VDVVHLAEVDASFDIAADDGVMVGASIHEGSHQRYVYRWLKAHQAAPIRMPTAAFTMCLAIRSLNEKERAEARVFRSLPGEDRLEPRRVRRVCRRPDVQRVQLAGADGHEIDRTP
jgi:menaquinone-dependent protoporphyrinogen IX oxidase